VLGNLFVQSALLHVRSCCARRAWGRQHGWRRTLSRGGLRPARRDGALARRRYVQMALQLLHEASLGSASRLAAYVAALPRGAALDPPLLWRPQELAALRYPHLEQQVLWAFACAFRLLISLVPGSHIDAVYGVALGASPLRRQLRCAACALSAGHGR